jgi:hypothetical protein
MSANTIVASSILELPRPISGWISSSRANWRGVSLSITRRATMKRAEKAESTAMGVMTTSGTAIGIHSCASTNSAAAVAA